MSSKPLNLSKPILETSVLSQADGSAVWTQDQTKIICSVTGPVEVKGRDEIPNAATLDLVVRPSIGLSCKLFIHCSACSLPVLSVSNFLCSFIFSYERTLA